MIDKNPLQTRLQKYIACEHRSNRVIPEIEALYQTLKSILDKGWYSTVVNSTDDVLEERILELVVAKIMSTEYKSFTTPDIPRRERSPDFLFNESGKTYTLEVTSVGLQKDESVVRENIKKFNSNRMLISGENYDYSKLSREIKSRVTSAFKEKANKYKLLKFDSQDSQGLIILISTGKIPFHSQIQMYQLASVFFGTGSLKLIFDKKQQKTVRRYYSYQHSFNKHSSKPTPTPISNCWFLSPKYKHVSGVILSQTESFRMLDSTKTECNWGNRVCNDFTLIHNPFAKLPVPKARMPVRNEIFFDTETGNITCLNENIYPGFIPS